MNTCKILLNNILEKKLANQKIFWKNISMCEMYNFVINQRAS